MEAHNDINPLTYAKRIAYSSEETLMFSYHQAVRFKKAPGCYCETGVAAGAQLIAMAHGAKGSDKVIFGFDSFIGIPFCSNRDNQMPGIKFLSKEEQAALPNPGEQVLETSGATAVSMDDVMKHIQESGLKTGKIILVPGWFENVLPTYDTGPIAMLRLDGDLYNSTWVCLQHLFPKVIKGGCVVVDDYQLPGCRAACDEYFDLIGYKPDYKFISNIAFFYK